jgi:hypothetical protein
MFRINPIITGMETCVYRAIGQFFSKAIRVIFAIGAGLGLTLSPGWAESGTRDDPPAEVRVSPFSGVLQPCDDPSMLDQIAIDFAHRELEFWNSSLTITGFERIGEFGYRLNGQTYIPRRYCQAEARFSDGLRRHLVFNISASTAFLGLGSGVVWCIQGIDRNHAFTPNCRSFGP